MKELVGGCLQAAGILIAGLFGLCTLMMLPGIGSFRGLVEGIGRLLSLAIPFAIGIGLIFAGRALVRSARNDRY